MTERVERLRARFDELGADAFVVSDPVNVYYLTGFASSNAVAVVGRDSATVVTDYRYVEAARSVDGFEVLEGERDIAKWVGERLADMVDGPVAFEADRLPVASHEDLAAGGVELVSTRFVLHELRAVKDARELEAIRRAAVIGDEMYGALVEHGLVGRTEKELAWFVERTMRDAGADAASFDPIVGSGPNGARPHHHPGDRRVERGELVVVDAGAKVDGYCSDCTRSFATGPLPDELARAYEVCLDAQLSALEAVRRGVALRDVYAAAHDVVVEGVGEHRQPGLGHGVGLEIHEWPALRKDADGALEAGNVVTVEPGIYLAGRGGVRIEDLVIVADDGPEILTPWRKELVTVD